MKILRETVRSIILENQLSPAGKVIDLMASWDMPFVKQALDLGETLEYFDVEDTTLGWTYSFSLKDCSQEFLAALESHPKSYTHKHDGATGITWDGKGSLMPLWHTPTTLILTIAK